MADGSMWAYTLTSPHHFERVDVPAPLASELADGEVVLRVQSGGICGSDLPYFRGAPHPRAVPVTSGRAVTPPGSPLHEVVGEVVASNDPTLHPGALVVGWATRSNALSEFVVVMGRDVYEFGADVAPTDAVMIQPLACVLHAVGRLNSIEGSTVAVLGQGPIGVLFSHVLKARGAAKVIGIDRVDRSEVAATFGVDESLWMTADTWANHLTDDERPDIVIEAVGHQVQTLVDATTALRNGGQIYYFGIADDVVYPLPMRTFLYKNATLIAGYTPPEVHRAVLAQAEEYLHGYPDLARTYLSDRFAFHDVEAAFALSSTPRRGRLKVTLEV